MVLAYISVKGWIIVGSPLSPIVANIFMENFEKEALETAPHPPSLWMRFVDDTFVILESQHKDEFFHHINSLENIINILWNTLDRKGNFPQWDSNPMPLICQTSALTARPQRNPNLSQITYPSDSCVVTELWPIYLHSVICTSHPCIGIYHCTSVPSIFLDGLPSSK